MPNMFIRIQTLYSLMSRIGKSRDSVEACDMRGMLSFMILWQLSQRPMYGQEIATEIGKRKGEKPNPGTIYPALKDLSNRGLIKAKSEGRNIVYSITEDGRASFSKALDYFQRAFGEIFRSTTEKPSGLDNESSIKVRP
jgi:PadR family transcriptional regulator, regulatory protein PadR